MKTKELTGRALDYAVALTMGISGTNVYEQILTRPQSYVFRPSTGICGDELIDAIGITTIRCDDDYEVDSEGFCTDVRIPVWAATIGCFATERSTEHQSHEAMYQILEDEVVYGSTRREAAMRLYVASKFGDEIELPEGL